MKLTHVLNALLARGALCTLATLGILGSGTSAHAADASRAAGIVTERCAMCHGADGAARSPVFPRLAGQNADYIAKQLADFKSGKRKSDAMAAQAADLSPEEIIALGQYFAAKPASAANARNPDLLALGRYIYTQGNHFSGVPECASCHGPRAHGSPQLPRLAGQHPAYVEEQLRQFSKRERTNDNDIMHTVAARLSALEAHAVAQYVATLD